jgi:hypothetical protein
MRDDCISGRGAKSLSLVVRSRGPQVATKKFNVFAEWVVLLGGSFRMTYGMFCGDKPRWSS